MRYALIKQTALKISADAVAVAHHADDQAETMLLGISRGSEGLLRGMRDDVLDERGRIIRPLLNATGEQIAAYANAFELTWMEDETNRDETVARNRIRRRILPYLKQELDPKLVAHLGSLAKKMQEDEDALSEIARKRMAELTAKRTAGVHLNDEVMSEPPAVRRRIFEEILRSLEVKRSTGLLKQLEDLFDRQSGKKVTLTENAEAVRDRTGILFRQLFRGDLLSHGGHDFFRLVVHESVIKEGRPLFHHITSHKEVIGDRQFLHDIQFLIYAGDSFCF